MGRVGKSKNGEYHDRIIDIDILLYDDLTVDEPDLKIPHPHMKERDFVMGPLREILESEEIWRLIMNKVHKRSLNKLERNAVKFK